MKGDSEQTYCFESRMRWRCALRRGIHPGGLLLLTIRLLRVLRTIATVRPVLSNAWARRRWSIHVLLLPLRLHGVGLVCALDPSSTHAGDAADQQRGGYDWTMTSDRRKIVSVRSRKAELTDADADACSGTVGETVAVIVVITVRVELVNPSSCTAACKTSNFRLTCHSSNF